MGVPPTAGFFGKFYLLQGILENRDWFLFVPAALTLGLNLYSGFRFMWLLYEPRKSVSLNAHIPFSMKAPLMALALAVLGLGLFHQDILRHFIEPALPKAYQNLPVPNVPFLGKQVE